MEKPGDPDLQTASGGVLDLSSVNIDEAGPVSLDGEWEFYPGKLIHPKEFTGDLQAEKGFIMVPSIWNGNKINGTTLSPYGCGTYRLFVKLNTKRKRFGIKLMTFSSAYRLYANGHLIASNGHAGETAGDTTAQHLPMAAYFSIYNNSQQKNIELVCQVSNFTHPKGGFWYSAYFGTIRQIQSLREKSVGKEMFFIGIFIIMGIFHLILFMMRKQNRYTLIFSLLCFVTALRASLVGENLLVSYFPGMNWEVKVRLEMLTFYLLPPLFSFFFYRFYSGYYSRRMNIVLSLPSCIFIPVLLMTPYRFSYFLMNFNNVLIFIGICYMFFVMFKTFRRFRLENSIFITGLVLLIITVFRDIMAVNQIIYATPIYPLGLSVFLLAQSIMISLQSSRAFRKAETLSVGLEKMVLERTSELDLERKSLKARNTIIERDLEMARSIQMKLIPQSNIGSFISYYYRPMNIIGGDFFDFIKFRDPERLGIFISDVSGHGVPAALLTSMIKTVLLQAGSLRENPSALLSHINDILIPHTDGYFVTAFYGIINFKTNEIIYSSAGHNPPFLIYEGRAEYLEIQSKMIPLGIIDSATLVTRHEKSFVNENAGLKNCSKILFYTDGLTEARNINYNPESEQEHGPDFRLKDFELCAIQEILSEYSDMQNSEFLDKLVSELTSFRGCDTFDDDVCVICVDIKNVNN